MDIKKLVQQLPTGFVDDAAGMGAAELRRTILVATATIEDIRRERDADEKLAGAKELVKEYGAGYKDALKAQAAKVAYCHHLLAERGQSPAGE